MKKLSVRAADQKIENAHSQRAKEQVNMRQSFSISDQGPTHGPIFKRPQTLVYKEATRDKENLHNRRRTDTTIYAQDYLKTWSKIAQYKPVLERYKMNIVPNYLP